MVQRLEQLRTHKMELLKQRNQQVRAMNTELNQTQSDFRTSSKTKASLQAKSAINVPKLEKPLQILDPAEQLEFGMEQSGQSTLCEDGIELNEREKASLTQTGFFKGQIINLNKDPFSPNMMNMNKTTQSFRMLSSSPLRHKRRQSRTEMKDISTLTPSYKKSHIHNSNKVVRHTMGERKLSPQRLKIMGRRKTSYNGPTEATI